jgi:hypothetical protein
MPDSLLKFNIAPGADTRGIRSSEGNNQGIASSPSPVAIAIPLGNAA